MPFESKSQSRKCWALKAKGQAKSWNCREWADKTDYKSLPEKAADFAAALGRMAGSSTAVLKQADSPAVLPRSALPAYQATPGYPAYVNPARSPLDMASWSEQLSRRIDAQRPGETPPQLIHDPRTRATWNQMSAQFDPNQVWAPNMPLMRTPTMIHGNTLQRAMQRRQGNVVNQISLHQQQLARTNQRAAMDQLRNVLRQAQQGIQTDMTGLMNDNNQALRALRGADAVTRVPMPGLGTLNPGGMLANLAFGRPAHAMLNAGVPGASSPTPGTGAPAPVVPVAPQPAVRGSTAPSMAGSVRPGPTGSAVPGLARYTRDIGRQVTPDFVNYVGSAARNKDE
jgi:hypothetical protein